MTTNNNHTYGSLEEIRLRKELLMSEIQKDEMKIKSDWNRLFHSQDKSPMPSKRFSGLMATGTGILDGVILGWKLYRKFKGNSLFRKR